VITHTKTHISKTRRLERQPKENDILTLPRVLVVKQLDRIGITGAMILLPPGATAMLSSDKLHPSAYGATALYAELLADAPEVMK
jgi:hypothetical protein